MNLGIYYKTKNPNYQGYYPKVHI